MNKFLILLFLICFTNLTFAFDRNYYTYSPYQKRIIRPTYNPYSNYYSYRKYNANNAKKIQRMNKIRQMNRIKNNISTWNFNRNNARNWQNSGTLTGYSLPVTTNTSFDTLDENFPSINTNTNLYSTPSGSEYYSNDGRYFKNFNETSGKTGVRIIYD